MSETWALHAGLRIEGLACRKDKTRKSRRTSHGSGLESGTLDAGTFMESLNCCHVCDVLLPGSP